MSIQSGTGLSIDQKPCAWLIEWWHKSQPQHSKVLPPTPQQSTFGKSGFNKNQASFTATKSKSGETITSGRVTKKGPQKQKVTKHMVKNEICVLWNSGKCAIPPPKKCWRCHVCLNPNCNGDHMVINCPKTKVWSALWELASLSICCCSFQGQIYECADFLADTFAIAAAHSYSNQVWAWVLSVGAWVVHVTVGALVVSIGAAMMVGSCAGNYYNTRYGLGCFLLEHQLHFIIDWVFPNQTTSCFWCFFCLKLIFGGWHSPRKLWSEPRKSEPLILGYTEVADENLTQFLWQ